mmetsp:Transcript_45932/g.82721  ORF Transcript_45932/g.82721 Transcript_45932/m.82721 type:complete len:269 (-) Transcript_45932:642-1448(-)
MKMKRILAVLAHGLLHEDDKLHPQKTHKDEVHKDLAPVSDDLSLDRCQVQDGSDTTFSVNCNSQIQSRVDACLDVDEEAIDIEVLSHSIDPVMIYEVLYPSLHHCSVSTCIKPRLKFPRPRRIRREGVVRGVIAERSNDCSWAQLRIAQAWVESQDSLRQILAVSELAFLLDHSCKSHHLLRAAHRRPVRVNNWYQRGLDPPTDVVDFCDFVHCERARSKDKQRRCSSCSLSRWRWCRGCGPVDWRRCHIRSVRTNCNGLGNALEDEV